MHLIVYVSAYTGEEGAIDEVLSDIINVSESYNADHQITGVLLYHNQRFVQFIEGPKAELETLMAKLEKTHVNNIQRVVDDPIEERGFNDWSLSLLISISTPASPLSVYSSSKPSTPVT